MAQTQDIQRTSLQSEDFVSTAPGSAARAYLCKFWNPIYHAVDLKVGRPVPLRIMNETYTLYRGGLTLRNEPGNRYAFTQGWVMSCDSAGALEVHEAIHVTQHFVLGPIAGPAAGVGVSEGVTRMSYFNNPYEIMAYATHNGARQDTDKLIFPSPWSYIFMSLWIAGAIAASIALTVHWV